MIWFGLAIAVDLGAAIRLLEFKNESEFQFNSTFCNGTPVENAVLDHPQSCLATRAQEFWMTFEDAGPSGYYRPEWKFHLWLESDEGFSFFEQNRILYAVIFYDGEGEISIHWDKGGKLHVQGGKGVKDILYPWAKGTIGRGNPYHEIEGAEIDSNGVKYFDYHGFVGYPETPFADP